MKDVEFRSYLKLEHKNVVWKKSIPSTWLEEKWQQLLKAILVYITCEGRYNRVMIYHFKLMNHFTCRSPLNLPFYLHKSLTKMAHQVKSQPTKIAGRLSHHALIKIILQELLQRGNIAWTYFLFWNEFETSLQPEDKVSPLQRSPPLPGVARGRGGPSHQ